MKQLLYGMTVLVVLVTCLVGWKLVRDLWSLRELVVPELGVGAYEAGLVGGNVSSELLVVE